MRSSRVLVIVAALTMVACGGGDDPTVGGEAPGDDDAAATTTAPPVDRDDDDLSALLEQGSEVRARVTYRITDADGSTEEITFSQDPPRFAFISDEGKFIVDGDDVVACGGGECTRFPAEMGTQMAAGMMGAITAPLLGMQEAARSGTPFGAGTDRREIAGRSAVCTTLEAGRFPGVTEEGSATFCADAELGVMLLWEVEHEGEVNRLEVIDLDDPRPDDFEPDSEPQTMPGG
jgi:hypothetical protein